MSAAPPPDDLRVWNEAAAPVHRWLSALDDLLGAVAVAGLAWPDGDLPADLLALAETGRGLGVTEGGSRLLALAGAVEAVRLAPVGPPRAEAEAGAFQALMALVGWVRRVRREVDLVEVQAALVVRGTTEAVARPRSGALTGGAFGVVGAELVGDKLAIHAVDLDRGTPALLLDRLEDVDPADPFGRPVVSRLFQARIRLGEVLRGAIHLRDHPVARHGGVEVVRPAFDAVAVAKPRREPPPLAPELGEAWPPNGAPARVRLTLGRSGDRTVVARGAPLDVPETATLRFTLTKLALREGPLVDLDAAVGVRQTNAALLAVDHPVDGRSLPALDPRAFPLDPGALIARVSGEHPGADWLRAVLSREAGGAGPELQRRLVEAPDSLEAAFWRGRGARVLGLDLPAGHFGFAARALAAARTPVERWMAVWLLLGQEDVEAAVRPTWRSWYEQAPSQPEPADLCARAALIPLFPNPGEADPTERAVSWLDAHLAAICGRARQARGLPSLGELGWLAEVRVMLTGDHHLAPLAALDLPPEAIRSAAIEAVWAALGPDGSVGEAAAAADAIWAVRLAGWRDQLWSAGR